MGAAFVHTSGSVLLSRSPHRPDQSLAIVQPHRTSSAADRIGFAHTIVSNTIQLRIRATEAEKNALLDFFNTIAQGMAEIFTYTDPLGISVAVRFAQDSISAREKAWDAWEISVVLRIFGGRWLWADGAGLSWANGQGVSF